MARVEQSIDVSAPLRTVYNQWTQFEDFPRFMDGVREVRQLDAAHLRWRAHRHGLETEWESEITEQVPDQLIAWRDTSGPHHSGSISFEPLLGDKTRMRMLMEFEPAADAGEAAVQEAAERIGQDLERFKRMIEMQGRESGAWRGEIHGGHALPLGATQDATATADKAVFQGARMEEHGGSASHPSGRWESWTDESAFGGARGASEGGSRPSPASAQGGEGASPGAGEHGSHAGASSALGGAQAWLRNQFPALEEPIGMMRRMTGEMDQLFERFIGRPMASRFGQGQGGMAGKWMPQVEILQLEDALLVCADLPGVKREEVHVDVQHDRLTIEGERHERAEAHAREGYRRSERSYGRFYRMIPLPHGVDPDQASASMHDGVLEVRVPMPFAARPPRRVDIG
ncbi:Hsp20 family protein [Lacisediminimonas profundi]|uniref:Hsp20 family protein n=1 Tax=Lacisediminimonas profundi TaxID=2603856 RepID=UPI00124B18AD|nr:Hsp20 family protein [Lacisediminimonas profundi]